MSDTVPPFFVPYADNAEEAKQVWQATKKFMERQGYSIRDRRIYSISYKQDDYYVCDRVGRKDRYGVEEILILFDAHTLYLCCTPCRGIVSGEPIKIGMERASVVEFR